MDHMDGATFFYFRAKPKKEEKKILDNTRLGKKKKKSVYFLSLLIREASHFGQREEARVPRRHRKNTQTPQRKAQGRNLLSVRQYR